MLLPGVYSSSTNFESFPVFLKDGVSIQGTSALNTIIDGEGNDALYVLPTSAEADFIDTYFDGFTVKNALSAITIPDELLALKPTFSNICLLNNMTGVRMVAVDLEGLPRPDDDTDGDNFIEHRPKLVNMTFSNNGIGISDEIVILTSPAVDHGEADPAIANCLFLDNGIDLDGTDRDDVVSDDNNRSNVFCEVTDNRIKAGRQTPEFSSLPFDCDSAKDVFISPETCDYRLRPSAAGPALTFLVDRGITPFNDSMKFHNGDTLIVPVGPCNEMVFDADMEGYGNIRIAGDGIDIGADEMGQLIVSGYAANTTSFSTGDVAQIWLSPRGVPAGQTYLGRRVWNERTNLRYLRWAPNSIPGTRSRGTVAPTPRPPFGLVYISNSGLQAQNLLGFQLGVPQNLTITTASSPARVNNQFLTSTPTTPRSLTNLQTYTVDP